MFWSHEVKLEITVSLIRTTEIAGELLLKIPKWEYFSASSLILPKDEFVLMFLRSHQQLLQPVCSQPCPLSHHLI